MKEILTTVTQRGQVTLPAEVRKLLGIKARDKVAFIIEDGRVSVAPAKFTLETAFGSVKPAAGTEDFKALSRIAWEDKIERDLEQEHRP